MNSTTMSILMKTTRALLVGLLVLSTPASSFQAPAAAPGGRGPGPGAGGPPPNPNAVSAAEFVIDPPTLINLGFEWFIQGDDNRNATVAVSYRKKGTTAWNDALPLLRLKGERVYQASQVDVIAPNMFAGSILDLEPDTPYEAQFVLSDPDGVRGESRRIVTVKTRPEPKPYEGGRVLHVYPHGFKGQKMEPSFEGLMCAYNYSCAGTDWATAGRPRVRPGDTILVHSGEYKYNRYEYTNDASVNRTTPLDGTYYFTADGTPEMPIAIKAAGDGPAIFDGAGNYALFDVRAADYTYFEGLTFRNTEIAILAGTQFLIGSKGLTAKNNRFENIGAGVFSNYSGSSNFYIADNWFYGRNDPNHLIGWAGPQLWSRFAGVDGQIFPPKMASYVAVKLYGPGHVVAYNYIADFHDGINIETYGNPDGSVASGPDISDGPKYPSREYWDRRPVAIDFYNNYITNSHDNPIEADGGMHNIRIMRNMLINHPSHAFCNQPSLGGPVYWIRNIAYNLPGGSTRLTSGSAGVLFYNNTILSETSGNPQNNHWRNNLMLGQNSSPAIFSVTTNTNYTSSDYNGFRPNPGAAVSFRWDSPPMNIAMDPMGPGLRPALQTRQYATLAEYSQATGQDRNSVLVDYDIFVKVPRLDAQDISSLQKLYKADDLDFRLKSGAAAVDRGMVLPTVTNGFAGRAPDLGALELGAGAPALWTAAVIKGTDMTNRTFAAIAAFASLVFPAIAATPIPSVRPLPVTATSYPFGAADHTMMPEDLKSEGYIEEEFLISGTANVYDWTKLGPATVRAANAPYTTRVLVRRPINRAKFSGIVAVEMLNPSNRFDLNIGWALSHNEFVRNGDAWVGITAKPIAVDALKTFNPERYKELSWANPVPLSDPRNCAMVANDSQRTTENGLVWDINTQTGSWLKSRDKSNPFLYGVGSNATHPVQHLYAWGFSQTGGFLATYANAIHPLDVQANGKPMFDAYLIGTPVIATSMNQCAGPIPRGDPRWQVHDTGVPVIRVMTTSDYLLAIAARQPDSDTATEKFRNYELAGAAHATPDELYFSAAPADIVRAGRDVPPMSCQEGPRSRFPSSLGFNAAWRALDEWVRKGIPAPHAEPVRVENGKPVLDEFGNLTGGVRSPFVDVPTATWTGSSTGASFCFIAGHETPLDPTRLKKLYLDHKTYERQVAANVAKLVKERWIVKVDGDELIAEAKKASIP